MTDTPATLSLEAMMSRDLVSRDHFEKEAVWLPALLVQHLNAGKKSIDGKTFTDCLIEGPAVMAIMEGTTLRDCAMGMTNDTRNLLYRPLGEKMTGVVALSNCSFVRCRFAMVGFTGSDAHLEQLVTGVTNVSDKIAGANS